MWAAMVAWLPAVGGYVRRAWRRCRRSPQVVTELTTSRGSWSYDTTLYNELSGFEAAAIIAGRDINQLQERAYNVFAVKQEVLEHIFDNYHAYDQMGLLPADERRLSKDHRELPVNERPARDLKKERNFYKLHMESAGTLLTDLTVTDFELQAISTLFEQNVHVVTVTPDRPGHEPELRMRTFIPSNALSEDRESPHITGWVLLRVADHFDVGLFLHANPNLGSQRLFSREELLRPERPGDTTEAFGTFARKWAFNFASRSRIFCPERIGQQIDVLWRKCVLFLGCQGQGKSSLIKHLTSFGKGEHNAHLPSTRDIMMYPAQLIALPSGMFMTVTAIDTVGLGDARKSVAGLFHDLKFALSSNNVVVDRIYICVDHNKAERFTPVERHDIKFFVQGLLELGFSADHFRLLFTHTDNNDTPLVDMHVSQIIKQEPFIPLISDRRDNDNDYVLPNHRMARVCGAQFGALRMADYERLEPAVTDTVRWMVEDLAAVRWMVEDRSIVNDIEPVHVTELSTVNDVKPVRVQSPFVPLHKAIDSWLVKKRVRLVMYIVLVLCLVMVLDYLCFDSRVITTCKNVAALMYWGILRGTLPEGWTDQQRSWEFTDLDLDLCKIVPIGWWC
jgi:hypothetical protein